MLLDSNFHDCLLVRLGAMDLKTLIDSVCFWWIPLIAISSIRITSCPGFLTELLAQLLYNTVGERDCAILQWIFNHILPSWSTYVNFVSVSNRVARYLFKLRGYQDRGGRIQFQYGNLVTCDDCAVIKGIFWYSRTVWTCKFVPGAAY